MKKGAKIFLYISVSILVVFLFLVLMGKLVEVRYELMEKRTAISQVERNKKFIDDSFKIKNISEAEIKIFEIKDLEYNKSFEGNYFEILHHRYDRDSLIFLDDKRQIIAKVNCLKSIKLGKKAKGASDGIINLKILKATNELTIGEKLKNIKKWKYFTTDMSGLIRAYWFCDKNRNVVDFIVTIDESASFWN